MILVTLGTQKQQFTRLLDMIENSNIKDKIIVQAGHTKYESKKMEIFDFIDYEEMNNLIEEADIVITHGGTGSILMPLKKGKKVIACARLKKNMEHIDNHQEQIISVFSEAGYIKELKENDDINKLVKETKNNFKPEKYKSNTANFIDNIKKDINEKKHIHNKFIYLILIFVIFIIISLIKYLNINENQLAILQYHHIIPGEYIEKYSIDSSYALSIETFEEQIKYLYDNGYKTISIDEFIDWKKHKIEIPEKSVMITIDDGCSSLKEYIEPLLKKYNFTAVAFIITDRVEEDTPLFQAEKIDYVGLDFISLKNLNIEFGSHSNSMHNLENGKPKVIGLNKSEIKNDLNISYEMVNSKVFSYPFSYFDKKIIKALEESNFDYAMRGHNKKTYQNEHDYLVSRIGDIGTIENFKRIFETEEYEQTIIDKIKGIWVQIKY